MYGPFGKTGDHGEGRKICVRICMSDVLSVVEMGSLEITA